MNLKSLSPYIAYIISLLIIVIVLYVRTFISERAKNKALIKDLRKMTEEKESVISKYQKEIELVKKEHELDIAKRKYQYESKKEAYSKFLTLLDNYNARAASEMTEKFVPITQKFMRDYQNATSKPKQNLVTTKYFGDTLELSQASYADYTKLKHETNAIKLCASDHVLKSLEELEHFTKINLEEADLMMKRIPTLIGSNPEDLAEYQNYINTLGKDNVIRKKYLIELMRLDMDNI